MRDTPSARVPERAWHVLGAPTCHPPGVRILRSFCIDRLLILHYSFFINSFPAIRFHGIIGAAPDDERTK